MLVWLFKKYEHIRTISFLCIAKKKKWQTAATKNRQKQHCNVAYQFLKFHSFLSKGTWTS